MSLKLYLVELRNMKKEISLSLFYMYVDYLGSEKMFSYNEVEILFKRYELLYLKACRKRNSMLNKIISIDMNLIDSELEELSKENIMKQVNKRILGIIYFDVCKYIPNDEESKVKISDKLFPILKNFSSFEIADIYRKFKKSAIIRGIVFDDNSSALLQQIFVGYIMSVLSHNTNNKYSLSRTMLTYEEVCKNILKEPILTCSDTKKRVR